MQWGARWHEFEVSPQGNDGPGQRPWWSPSRNPVHCLCTETAEDKTEDWPLPCGWKARLEEMSEGRDWLVAKGLNCRPRLGLGVWWSANVTYRREWKGLRAWDEIVLRKVLEKRLLGAFPAEQLFFRVDICLWFSQKRAIPDKITDWCKALKKALAKFLLIAPKYLILLR